MSNHSSFFDKENNKSFQFPSNRRAVSQQTFNLRVFGTDLTNRQNNNSQEQTARSKEENQKIFKFQSRISQEAKFIQNRTSFDVSFEDEPFPCDIQHKNDPQYVTEYASQIFRYLRENEGNLPDKGYMYKQKEINSLMRGVLITWLKEVQLHFQLSEETLFLTVNLIDRYLSIEIISIKMLQLVGIACLLIASKYEDIYSPGIDSLIDLMDDCYTKNQVIEMEGKILNTLKFKLNVTSSLKFLDRYSTVHNIDLEHEVYRQARHILELTLVEYTIIQYPPSMIAVSALCIACNLCKVAVWSEDLGKASLYNLEDIKPCIKALAEIMAEDEEKRKLDALTEIFSKPKC